MTFDPFPEIQVVKKYIIVENNKGPHHKIMRVLILKHTNVNSKLVVCKAKRHNKSDKLFGYLKRYLKSDIRNIDLRNPKHTHIYGKF